MSRGAALGASKMFLTTGAANDLLTLFVALEVFSLPLYLLCALARRKRLMSQEAAVKYFLLGAFASAFTLFGIALLYGYAGSVSYGTIPPVVHIDSAAPLYDDDDGSLITDEMWGIYYKPDFSFGGVQGGASPQQLHRPADDIAVDPYGPASPEFAVGDGFVRMWTSALAHCHKRFEGKRHLYQKEPSGGIGAFTPDSFPVFDVFRQNAYVIADSNHGFKMIGVGALVAKELLGEQQGLLEPFRFGRYRTGDLHPVSNSPFPWS